MFHRAVESSVHDHQLLRLAVLREVEKLIALALEVNKLAPDQRIAIDGPALLSSAITASSSSAYSKSYPSPTVRLASSL